MISIRTLQKLTFALPRCMLTAPDDVGRMYIIDRNGERAGDINFRSAIVSIYEEYTYCNQVLSAIEKQGEKVTIRRSDQ